MTNGAASQADFFQLDFSPDGAINVPFRDNVGDARFDILFTRQTSGPNLDGGPMCGVTGSP